MKYFIWNSDKNEQLKRERDISFEQIVIQIEEGKSLEEGIPYQTLISSILHKFTSGKLVEKSN